MDRAFHQAGVAPRPQESLYRTDDVIRSLAISRRTFERLRAAGAFPSPDLRIGRINLWRSTTVSAWIDAESERQRRGVA